MLFPTMKSTSDTYHIQMSQDWLDETGEIVVAGEAERINHDVGRAVPEDFDKMADCDVEEAGIWVVPKQADGHRVLAALNKPLEGEPRVEKTYAKTTPPQQFRIDTPGFSLSDLSGRVVARSTLRP